MEGIGPPHQLAQINVARFRRPKGDPANSDYLAALDAVAASAEAGPGLVWRFDAATAPAPDRFVADDPYRFVNLSVWTGLDALRAFTYADPLHRAMMRQRRDWFERAEVTLALWWVPAGTRPTLADGLDRLARIGRHGSTAGAFTFARPFGADGHAAASASGPPA